MLVSEFVTPEFVGAIPYIKDNESDKTELIAHAIIDGYGDKTTAPLVDRNPKDVTHVADIVDLYYHDKWKALKDSYTGGLKVDKRTTGNTKTTTNKIAGYNGELATDYEKTETNTSETQPDNLYNFASEAIEFFDNSGYYKTIVTDIVSLIATSLYY